MDNQIRVAVIGAGVAGLAAIKECLDAGLHVTAFEAQDHIGGQWAYQPCAPDADPADVWSSVYAGTMLNSCRSTTSFTDFPLDPARYGDYFNHRSFLGYLQEYAAHFGLDAHIRLRTKVLVCTPRPHGEWAVRVEGPGTDGVAEERFGAVMVCTGCFSKPVIPAWPGRDEFKGQFLHSHLYRTPGPFEGKKVVVVGLGSSAVDVACEIAPHAAELHLVTRRGGWILPRYVLGKPIEAWDSRLAQVVLPASLSAWLQTKLLQAVDLAIPEALTPEHGIFAQGPTIRGDFLEKVTTGLITVHRGTIETIRPAGVTLSTGEMLDADVVIAATGYDYFHLPYLPSDVVRADGSPEGSVDLYKLMMSPRYDNLFMLGFIESFGPLAPIVEGQARHAAAILTGRLAYPTQREMRAQIQEWQRRQASAVIDSDRHKVLLHSLGYMDELLEPLGVAPTLGRLLGGSLRRSPWTTMKLLNAVWFNVPASAQYRLFGPGRKEALAEATLLRIGEDKGCLSAREMEILAEKKVTGQ